MQAKAAKAQASIKRAARRAGILEGEGRIGAALGRSAGAAGAVILTGVRLAV